MDTTAINKTLIRERAKLERQHQGMNATAALIQLLEAELNKLEGWKPALKTEPTKK